MNDQPIIESPERGLRSEHYFSEPYGEERESGSQFDVAWLRGAVFRQRWVIVGSLLFALIAGLAVTLLSTPIFEATATVRLNARDSLIVEGQDVARENFPTNRISDYLRTQEEIIKSRSMAETVARELNLGNRSAIVGDAEQTRPPNQSDEQWEEAKIKRASLMLQKAVNAVTLSPSSIIAISFSSPDPALAAEIANAYSKAFTQSDIRQSLDANAYAREYLLGQIEEIRNRLGEAEVRANTFARSQGIVTENTVSTSTEEGGQVTITGAKLSAINQTVSTARAARIAAEQKWRAVANIPASQVPDVLSSPFVQNLIAERAKLNTQLLALRQRYTDDFAAIVDLRSQIDLINRQIESAGTDVKTTIRSEYLVALQQEQALEAELNSVKSEALAEQDKRVEYMSLEGEVRALRDQLQSLRERYNQISTAANVQSSVMAPLDMATVPSNPVSPKLSRNLLLAITLGIALGGALAVFREVFVDQFRRVEDIEDRLGLPTLGVTPKIKDTDIKHEESVQFSSLMEAYSAIRSTIDYSIPRGGAVLQLTSSQASEGKSTTALILAQMFARLGRKTLVLDLDLRKPSLHALLGMERPAAGVAEVLLGHVAFEDARLNNVSENLTALTVAGIPPDPISLLSSAVFREFVEDLRNEFSLIIIDSSPLVGLADAVEIAKVVDATVFVIEANRTSVAQARASVRRLKAVGANLLGVVLTKYQSMQAGDDYGYQYSYYQYGKD